MLKFVMEFVVFFCIQFIRLLLANVFEQNLMRKSQVIFVDFCNLYL